MDVVDLAKSQALGEGIDVTYYDVMQKATTRTSIRVVYTGDTLKGFTASPTAATSPTSPMWPPRDRRARPATRASTKWQDKLPFRSSRTSTRS